MDVFMNLGLIHFVVEKNSEMIQDLVKALDSQRQSLESLRAEFALAKQATVI
jgi:hypothetical protein